jgi:hypothetical protein
MLIPGHRYRVTQAFQDFDKDLHVVGETWTYLGCAHAMQNALFGERRGIFLVSCRPGSPCLLPLSWPS